MSGGVVCRARCGQVVFMVPFGLRVRGSKNDVNGAYTQSQVQAKQHNTQLMQGGVTHCNIHYYENTSVFCLHKTKGVTSDKC